jgi:hypothetical protein
MLNFFKKVIKLIEKNTMEKAYIEIASHLQCEFPYESHDYLVKIVKEGRIDELRQSYIG